MKRSSRSTSLPSTLAVPASASGGSCFPLSPTMSSEYGQKRTGGALLPDASRAGIHIGDGERAARTARRVATRSVPQVIVNEEHLARPGREGNGSLFRSGRGQDSKRDGPPERRRQTGAVAAVDRFDAARFARHVVESGPDLQLGVAVESPEVAAVLMPGQVRAARGGLREERRPVERDAGTNHGSGDALERLIREPRPEERVELQLLDLPVREAGALPSASEREILVAPGGRVRLEEHALVHHSSEHDVVRSLAKAAERVVARDGPEAGPPVFAPVGNRGGDIERLGVTRERQ